MTLTGTILKADEGKVLRRIADQFVYGDSIYLGLTYYIGGKLLSTPHQDVESDFEEIDKPNSFDYAK